MSLLSIQNLNVRYDKKLVIDELNLYVNEGEIVGLFGPSGSGKTTILKALVGLIKSVSGTIKLAGKSLLTNSVNVATEKRNIGLVFQDYALFPHLTVSENIGFGLTHLSSSEKQSKVDSLLALIKLEDHKCSFPHQLSGGQQQRVAIVRALATEPKLLLLDEAFSNLDPQFRFELIEEIRNIIKSLGITAIFVTHNQDEAFAFCDKIAVMQEGKIAQLDTPQALFNAPANEFVAEFLGTGVWLPSIVKSSNELSSDWGVLPYDGEEDLSELIGQAVKVYLRPHQLGLTTNLDSVDNKRPQFKVEHQQFVGEFFQTEVSWNRQSIKIKTHSSFLNQLVAIRLKQPIKHVFKA